MIFHWLKSSNNNLKWRYHSILHPCRNKFFTPHLLRRAPQNDNQCFLNSGLLSSQLPFMPYRQLRFFHTRQHHTYILSAWLNLSLPLPLLSSSPPSFHFHLRSPQSSGYRRAFPVIVHILLSFHVNLTCHSTNRVSSCFPFTLHRLSIFSFFLSPASICNQPTNTAQILPLHSLSVPPSDSGRFELALKQTHVNWSLHSQSQLFQLSSFFCFTESISPPNMTIFEEIHRNSALDSVSNTTLQGR